MMRHISGPIIVLVLAIAVVAATIYARRTPPQIDDPAADAAKEMYDRIGFEVAPAPAGGLGGLTVQRVKPGSPAEMLGLKAGDRFVAVNDRSIWHAKSMRDLLDQAVSAGPVSLLVANGDTYRQVILGGRRGGAGRAGPGGGRRGPAGRVPAPAPGAGP